MRKEGSAGRWMNIDGRTRHDRGLSRGVRRRNQVGRNDSVECWNRVMESVNKTGLFCQSQKKTRHAIQISDSLLSTAYLMLRF